LGWRQADSLSAPAHPFRLHVEFEAPYLIDVGRLGELGRLASIFYLGEKHGPDILFVIRFIKERFFQIYDRPLIEAPDSLRDRTVVAEKDHRNPRPALLDLLTEIKPCASIVFLVDIQQRHMGGVGKALKCSEGICRPDIVAHD